MGGGGEKGIFCYLIISLDSSLGVFGVCLGFFGDGEAFEDKCITHFGLGVGNKIHSVNTP